MWWPWKKKKVAADGEPETPKPEIDFCDAEGKGSLYCMWKKQEETAEDMCPPCLEIKPDEYNMYSCNFINNNVTFSEIWRGFAHSNRNDAHIPIRYAVRMAKHILHYTKGVTQDG